MRWWRYAWPGFLATLAGVGFGRFAFSSLMPFLVGAGATTAAGAAYLGAANLAGYFIGAATAARIAQRFGMTPVLRGALVLSTLSFAASMLPWGFWWYFPWRVLVGITGGYVMVLAASFLYAGSPPEARGRIGGVVFTGVGAGIVLASTLVTPLARLGLTWAWGAMAVLTLAITVATWPRWRGGGVVRMPARRPLRLSLPAGLAIAGFALDGVGYVAHALFWVDFIARGLHRGIPTGAFAWLLFGLGATGGPLLAGAMGDVIGLGAALSLGLFVKSAAVLLPVFSTGPLALAVSSLVVGALTPAFPALTSARLTELVAPLDLTRAWGLATLSFALMQAIAGYGMSYVFQRSGAYLPLFVTGSAALFLGGSLAFASVRLQARRTRQMPRHNM